MNVHALFEIAGSAAGVLLYARLRAKHGDPVSDRARLTVLIGAALGATVGARLLWWIGEPNVSFAQILAGKTIVGGLLGGLLGVEIAKKLAGIRTSTGDLFVLPLVLATIIGRIGCFLAGPLDRTHGHPSTLPWAMAIGEGVRRHPVALYEIAFLLLLVPVLVRVQGRPGDRFRVYLASYLGFRLFVDFLKPFPEPVAGGLTAIQWACLAGLLHYAAGLARRSLLKEVPA